MLDVVLFLKSDKEFQTIYQYGVVKALLWFLSKLNECCGDKWVVIDFLLYVDPLIRWRDRRRRCIQNVQGRRLGTTYEACLPF